MFDFFRMDENDFNKKREDILSINPDYWRSKCVSEDRSNGTMQYSKEVLENRVKEEFDNFFDEQWGSGQGWTEEQKQDLWEELERGVLGAENGYEAHESLGNFEYNGFKFREPWEYNLDDYDVSYLWCLYAIVWGIKKYDENKGKK